jgi:DNA-directed RNA polymerase specialized sigma24 family protein
MAMVYTFVMDRLRVWAIWRIRRDEGGLGYPRKSAFAKTEGSSFWTPEMDSASVEMDQCVCALPPALRQVVMLEYTRTGTQQQKANECGCCLRTYTNRLGAAYQALLGLMNDQAAGIKLPVHIEAEPGHEKKMLAHA